MISVELARRQHKFGIRVQIPLAAKAHDFADYLFYLLNGR